MVYFLIFIFSAFVVLSAWSVEQDYLDHYGSGDLIEKKKTDKKKPVFSVGAQTGFNF